MKKLSDDSRQRWSEEKMILCVFFVRAFYAAHTIKIVEFTRNPSTGNFPLKIPIFGETKDDNDVTQHTHIMHQ